MNRRTGAWELLVGASLLLGCNGGPKTATTDDVEGADCSANTKCPGGYECDYGKNNPSNPLSVGECRYQVCGLTEVCEKATCPLAKQTPLCDKKDKNKFCECHSQNSEEVPTPTPTSGPKEDSP